MTEIEAVIRELDELGLNPQRMSLPFGGEAVALDYCVPTGRYRGKPYRIAVSFQESAYPEYPPHFLHVCDLEQSTLTPYRRYSHDGATWSMFSVPPGDFWDRLPPDQKTMKTYFNRHIQRVWHQL